MKLYMPTKVYNEKNCVENHSRELAALGTKALIAVSYTHLDVYKRQTLCRS